MTITTIYYDWFFTRDGKGYEKREVGKDGVTEIEEHPAKWEGDKWRYVIHYEDGTQVTTFNPNQVIRK